jgi:hypothetical protein
MEKIMRIANAVIPVLLILIGGCSSNVKKDSSGVASTSSSTSMAEKAGTQSFKTVYRVCVGETASECKRRYGNDVVHEALQDFPPSVPGGPDDNQRVADNVCQRSGKRGDGARGVRLDTQSGGKGGYLLIEVTCFDY